MDVIRLATFNAHHCLGPDSIIDIDRTARAITATDAAVVALQEIDRRLPRSGRIDQPAEIAKLTGMKVLFWPTIRRWRGEYGIGLAVRADADVEFRLLPRIGREEQRGAIVGRAAGLGVVATHAATAKDGSRPMHLKAIRLLAAELGAPTVIMGDLNARRSELDGFIAEGWDAGPEIPTFGRNKRRQIDYILAGPGVRLVRAWTVASDASDHLPLVAEVAVEYRGPPETGSTAK
jgi:endonuclease/exonuclease/phosphatase family metal-dependent hydrolase